MSLFTIEHRLKGRLKRLLSLFKDLTDENSRLRQKELVMLSLLQDQVDSLYRLSCLSLSGEWSTDTNNDAVLQAATTDVKAYELLQYAGHAGSCMGVDLCSTSPKAAVTTQRLRAAVTLDAVLAVQSASTQELALRLQQLTRRLALLSVVNAAPKPTGAQMADSLDIAVEEYGQFCMSLHVGAHRQCMELCCLNLDTLQPETPPAGYWASVAAQVGLSGEQIERLLIAFQVYQEKRLPLVAEAQHTVQRLQQLQGHTEAVSNTADSGGARTAGAAATAGMLLPSGGAATAAAAAWKASSWQGHIHLEAAASSRSSCTTSHQQQSCDTQFRICAWGKSISEQVDELLQQLLSLTKRMRELARHVTMHWVNTLTTEQMATSITASYPFWPQPVLVCEVLWRQQQGEDSVAPDVLSTCSTR